MTNLVRLNERTKEEICELASRYIKEGKLIVYPTDTLYGLGANALDEKAVKKVFEVKKRPLNKPLPIAVCNIKMMERYVYLNDIAKLLVKEFLPGALTLILRKKESIPDIVTSGLENVAVRIPDNDICLEIIKKSDLPITTTSANISGKMPPIDVKEVEVEVDLIIDAGKLKERIPSTIVDVSSGEIKLVREGKIKFSDIMKVVKS